MALQGSTNIDDHEVSYTISQHDRSSIELSEVAGNVYESLENNDRDSHAYSTTVARSTTKSSANNVKSDEQPRNKAKSVPFQSLKVEIPCQSICQIAIGILLFCTLICTISGGIVYHVINGRIADVERYTTQNYKALDTTVQRVQEKQNLSAFAAQDTNQRLDTLASVMQAVKETQNTSAIAAQDTNQRLETLANTSAIAAQDTNQRLDTLASVIQTVKETQNTSAIAAQDTNQRLETLDNLMQAVQKKQNTSDQHVAFSAHKTDGTVVDKVLIFQKMILNAGNGYNLTTGRFRCPVAGIYLFSATLLTVHTKITLTWCYIRKNAYSVAVAISYDGKYESGSGSVILHLSAGDFVDLGHCNNPGDLSRYAFHNSFIGALIQAD